ncbi:hypothetical protein SESBI_06706 [Sesbania bispinosa]|nr:hypothetical protein SESBI_06706 [Sesbania bispinosa]
MQKGDGSGSLAHLALWAGSAAACDPSTVRCSVKPASRGALPSRNHETSVFAQVSWLNSQLGAGRPAYCMPPAQPSVARAMFHHLGAPTWVTSWRYSTRHADMLVRNLIKTVLCHTLNDVGLTNV